MRNGLDAVEIDRLRVCLIGWFAKSQRDLPWRRTREPYAIWISETMLQQTRVAAVIPYYERFLRLFPDVTSLANAPEPEVLAAWSGLGYYYRARNLQKAAQMIQSLGAFPGSYDKLRELPGVGDYTAAAVSSIAFGLPHAVIDGNVLRVLSRVTANPANIASGSGRRHFAQVADQLLDRRRPSEFNQALMELGATICLPKNPQCLLCPLAELCRARAAGSQARYPVKSARQKSVDEERTLLWIERDGCVLAWQRPADSKLMPGFWELPEGAPAGKRIGSFRHSITFHNYDFTVVEAVAPSQLGECRWIDLDAVEAMPISTVFRKALRLKLRATRNAAAASAS